MKRVSSNYFFMSKTRRKRCPECRSINVIKWGRQASHQRYRCKNCGRLFTYRRKDVKINNMYVWFRWWVIGKQTIEQIVALSGYSVRHLKSVFYIYLERAPQWTIKRKESVNLLIDGTYFRNKVCLVVYRGYHIKSTLFYRLTDKEREWEIIQDLQTLRTLGVRVESVTSDGSREIIRAVKYVFPHASRQRCLVHIERECLAWITQFPKTSAGITLRRLVLQISDIKTHNDERFWKIQLEKWHLEYGDFLKEKTVSRTTGTSSYTHDKLRKAYYHIWRALPDMFKFIGNPRIPKSTNALESFFGHLKDNLRPHRGLSLEHHKNFIKWYLFFKENRSKIREK